MIFANLGSLLLAPVAFLTTVSALAIAPEAQATHPQIYSKKLHSAKIFEALTTRKNFRTVTRTVDAAAITAPADVDLAVAHLAHESEDFTTRKPWDTMTIEQDEVVYVTTTKKKTSAKRAAQTPDSTPSIEWQPRWSELLLSPGPHTMVSSSADGWHAKHAAMNPASHDRSDLSVVHLADDSEPTVVVKSVTVTTSGPAAATASTVNIHARSNAFMPEVSWKTVVAASAAATSSPPATTVKPGVFNPDLLPAWYWEWKSSSLALEAAKSSSSSAPATASSSVYDFEPQAIGHTVVSTKSLR